MYSFLQSSTSRSHGAARDSGGLSVIAQVLSSDVVDNASGLVHVHTQNLWVDHSVGKETVCPIISYHKRGCFHKKN